MSNVHIGIWQHTIKNGKTIYSRDKNFQKDWKLWANVHVIPPKSKKRIVLLGESVARGYFLDPHYNPAGVLQKLLDSQCQDEFEIIDLAKVNLRLLELKELLKSSLALLPEAIVIFAGNNWLSDLYFTLSEKDVPVMIQQISTRGMEGLRSFLEQRLEELITEVFKDFQVMLKDSNVHLTYVIPEFNLADWSEYDGDAGPDLTYEQAKLWENLVKQLMLEESDVNKYELSNALIQIDPSNSFGYANLGRFYLEDNQPKLAYSFFQKALDRTTVVFTAVSKPKIIKRINNTIVKLSNQQKFTTVNLADAFRAHRNDQVPDRNLFYDYCHLNVDGINIAMSYTAAAILRQFGKSMIPPNLLISRTELFVPDALVEAQAHAFSAIHNAHHGQNFEIVRYHLRKAVSKEPKIVHFLSQLVELMTLKAPNILCRQYENILNILGDQHYGGLDHEPNKKLMNMVLADAIIDVSKELLPNLEQSVKELRSSQHSVNERNTINLLESYYSSHYYKSFQSEGALFFEEYRARSYFNVVVSDIIPLMLCIIYRVVEENTDFNELTIYINGQILTKQNTKKTWQKSEVRIAEEYLIEGVNHIEIEWPAPLKKDLSLNGSSLTDILNYVRPCRGQLHEFYVHQVNTGIQSSHYLFN